jgi:hypothetical protein
MRLPNVAVVSGWCNKIGVSVSVSVRSKNKLNRHCSSNMVRLALVPAAVPEARTEARATQMIELVEFGRAASL